MNKNVLFLLLIVFIGCNEKEKNSSKVYFAGEIVNPTNEYVILHRGDKIIDSAKLDNKNRFSFVLPDISEGLHHFNTSRELQYVFIEKSDSIQIRLNTMDFDESLVFSGTEGSAEINNFLLDLFLSNEKEERRILKNGYGLEPSEFSEHVESLRHEKLESLKSLKDESNLSLAAVEIAEAAIEYSYSLYKEEYPFEHKKHTGQQVMQNLPDNFYKYRNDISFNKKHLNYLRPYYRFMQSHIRNLSFSRCSAFCEIKDDVVRNQLHFNRHKLSMIDSLVKESELKDNLFRNVAFNYLLMSNDNEKNIETFISDFHYRSGNNRHIEEITALYQGIQNIQPKKKVPNVLVTNTKGGKTSLHDICKDGKVVFYFWSGKDKRHFTNITKRVKHLTSSKQDYKFVGISIRTDSLTWRGMIDQAGLNSDYQFMADNFEQIGKTLMIDKLNKCIITEDATIVDAFSDMYTASL